MDWQVLYMLGVLLAIISLVGAFVHAWQFRHLPAAKPLLFFIATAACWSICVVLMATATPSFAVHWLKLKYLFIGLTPVGAFLFALRFTGRDRIASLPLGLLLGALPLATQWVLWQPSWQHLMLQNVVFTRIDALSYTSTLIFGPYYWLFAGYSYLLILAGVGLTLVALWGGSRLLRRQGGLLVAGLLMPLVTNVLLITGLVPRQYDLVPIGLAVAVGLLWLAMLRYRLFNLMPVLRNRTLDAVSDGVLVLDLQHRVVDMNHAFANISQLNPNQVIGLRLDECLRELPDLSAPLLASLSQGPDTLGHQQLLNWHGRRYELNVAPLRDGAHQLQGHTLVLHDLHERLTLEAQLRARNDELEQAYRHLEQTSLTDPLTGLRNRRFVMQQIGRDLQRCRERYLSWLAEPEQAAPEDADLIAFLVDLDHFKQVNDQHGHAAGDELLQQVQARLQSVFREDDYLVRWGGEEFLVVTRHVPRGLAPQLAERLRLAFAQAPFPLSNGTQLHKTCSIGFACYPFLASEPHALSWPQVIDLADQALYQAKQQGRNRWYGYQAAHDSRGEAIRQFLQQPDSSASPLTLISQAHIAE
ncbi:histidine kinase N-terminal 7TM domain-containing diguanylate cyclase [Atopomonas sediminilitoris]|uniref:histidine kinase N-terminal 7TM domain-containing diguanylate cyclase n=1 Tax=Atopomonas sediminilitoris TaxID=2919919 RepID=UPI001F4D9E48|nr:histidine kinase N-terminal 7TM domain-containing protein [Atopomonas sediminilitoris]MCJ8169501.1 diguanylate cyclase [Atopomonas sediminilitoris]